ncbi:hypothetical protein AAG565_03575 [Fontimonas sp. SYSU GA230001]|uniref:hypothetical protein n=1 Tax=Fontimonas sp. SYSU GA230001 TaxID=3142450 RepID=UPI0032B51A68
MALRKARVWGVAAVAALGLGLAAGMAPQWRGAALQWLGAADCPAGYEQADPVAVAAKMNPGFARSQQGEIRRQFGERICAWRKLPASFAEKQIEARDIAGMRGLPPPGALRQAVEQKAALKLNQAKVANAVGQWAEYGSGPQVSDPAYPDGANDGIPEVAGRADNFAYDPVAQRLFVAIGNGGIWMSQAVGGDVGTLGDQWVSIGDRLPTLVTSAVAWTPARGGRVLALTGEHVQGGNTYVGLGAYWSDDLGQTWHHASGVPDGTNASRLAVDPSNPDIVYAATGMGLFRSEDAGASYRNVALPVSAECAGVTGLGPCQLANFVTDVVVKEPGGVTDQQCSAEGCPVLAAVGFRSGALPYADGRPQSPGNGLYRSDTGKPGTFARVGTATGQIQSASGGLVPVGFAPQARIGRIELGHAIGPAQDHNYVYAIVQDAVLLNGGVPVLDLPTDDGLPSLPLDCEVLPEGDPQFVCELATQGFSPTSINGVYVSPDFGDTWIRLADDVELTYAGITTGSSLAAVVALGIGPGVQAWYDLWIKPDPTAADPLLGAPTRVAFGMEEIWKNRVNAPVTGLEQTPNDFKVIGTYFAGNTCLFLLGNIDLAGLLGLPVPNGPPVCPFRDGLVTNITTTHPDQHDGIFIPDEQRGGVWLFAGNDGGVYKQYSANTLSDDLDNTKWGSGANRGFYTLMNYGISVARDGTVYYGLQDNASGKIEPDTRRQLRIYVGDGMWTAVDPDNSDIAYYQTPGLALVRTTDGGKSNDYIDDFDVGSAHFLSPFRMDPRDANHLVAAGTKVAETLDASTGANWTTVFDLGTNEATGGTFQSRGALEVEGDAVYVGACAPCNITASGAQFQNRLATNVGGSKPPKKGTSDGWHVASANGLPNRYIYDIEADPTDPRTVYVVLGGYSTARWLPDGQYLDSNPNRGSGRVFKSTDAGETFVDISGDLPDVITTAIVKRGEQLIVGTDIGVFISSDLQGSAWAPLGDLPSVPVNQLVLKPGDDRKLFAATFGRGVQVYDFAKATDGGGSTGGRAPDAGRFGGAMPAGGLLLLLAFGLLRRRPMV